MYFTNVKQLLSKTITAKRSALELLPLYHSTITYIDVVKGKNQIDNNDDSISNITDSLKEIKGKETKLKLTNNKLKKSKIRSDRDSLNDNSSIWSKESVVNQIKVLSAELEKEKKEREIERNEQLKEKEESQAILEGMKQFQNLLLSINDKDTDEEISIKVRSIAKKMKRNEQ